jgi:threonine aldolase
VGVNFGSDNVSGIAPQILDAIGRANVGTEPAYGMDAISARVEQKMSDLFERPCRVFMAGTGTAANALAVSALLPPWGAVLCHQNAHIHSSECNAPMFFSGGAGVTLLPGEHNRIDPAALAAELARQRHPADHAKACALSLTQATEAGTLYTPEQVATLCAAAKGAGLKVHMDGARFANAVAALGCKPADLTWRAGVDVLTFGATKNGALAAEAVVAFDPALAEALHYRRKRAGHLFSKMRFIAAQMEAYLTDGLWLSLAANANARARQMATGLARLPGVKLEHPVEINEVFVHLTEPMIRALHGAGFTFPRRGGAASTFARLVCAFNTRAEDVDELLAVAAAAAAKAG